MTEKKLALGISVSTFDRLRFKPLSNNITMSASVPTVDARGRKSVGLTILKTGPSSTPKAMRMSTSGILVFSKKSEAKNPRKMMSPKIKSVISTATIRKPPALCANALAYGLKYLERKIYRLGGVGERTHGNHVRLERSIICEVFGRNAPGNFHHAEKACFSQERNRLAGLGNAEIVEHYHFTLSLRCIHRFF